MSEEIQRACRQLEETLALLGYVSGTRVAVDNFSFNLNRGRERAGIVQSYLDLSRSTDRHDYRHWLGVCHVRHRVEMPPLEDPYSLTEYDQTVRSLIRDFGKPQTIHDCLVISVWGAESQAGEWGGVARMSCRILPWGDFYKGLAGVQNSADIIRIFEIVEPGVFSRLIHGPTMSELRNYQILPDNHLTAG